MIDGVVISPRRQIVDERGKVMHMLKKTDPEFNEFGEIYFSFVFPGVVKAWHLHERMIINYSVPVGRIKLVLFDSRSDSPTKGELQEIYLGEDQHCLVTIPPLVWNGFKGLGTAVGAQEGAARCWRDESLIWSNCRSDIAFETLPPILPNPPMRRTVGFIDLSTTNRN